MRGVQQIEKKMRKVKIKKFINIVMMAFIIIMLISQVCFALDTSKYTEIYKKPDGIDTFLDKGRKDIGCSASCRY